MRIRGTNTPKVKLFDRVRCRFSLDWVICTTLHAAREARKARSNKSQFRVRFQTAMANANYAIKEEQNDQVRVREALRVG